MHTNEQKHCENPEPTRGSDRGPTYYSRGENTTPSNNLAVGSVRGALPPFNKKMQPSPPDIALMHTTQFVDDFPSLSSTLPPTPKISLHLLLERPLEAFELTCN